MQKYPIYNGISLLPPCRAGSNSFSGRIYIIVFSNAQNKAHREIKAEDLKILYLSGHIIMMKVVHLLHCYKVK